MDYQALIHECAKDTHPTVMQAVIKTESGFNPYAIGVVNGYLKRQPKNKEEAIATAKNLQNLGYNFSVGAAQVNKFNFQNHGLTVDTAFDPCSNIKAGSKILGNCYSQALKKFSDKDYAMKAAFSCYYSGNFKTGFINDSGMTTNYVQRVSNNIGEAKPIEVISTKPKKVVKVKAVDDQIKTENQQPSQPQQPEKPKAADWDVFQEFKPN